MTTPIIFGGGRLRARRALLTLTTALCTGLAAPAFAGSPHPNLDANGVDLTTGEYGLRLPVASIGTGSAELPLVIYSKTYDNWTGISSRQSSSAGGNFITIDLGPQYDTFKSTDGYATSIRGTGATLSFNGNEVIYRTLDGTAIVFGDPVGSGSGLCDSSTAVNCTRLPISITRRNGMTVAFNWTVHERCSIPSMPDEEPVCTYSWRLGGVSNEAGYSVGYGYATSTVAAGQAPPAAWFRRTAATLSGAGSTRTVTYANPTANVFTVMTPGGKTWRITDNGLSIVGVRRPSATSDTTTVSYSGAAPSSVTRDGVITNYSYGVAGSTATMVVTDAQSRQTTIVSDLAKFRPTSVTDPASRTTTMTYDGTGRATEVTYPEGNKVQYTYDVRGNVTETRLKAKPSVGGADIVTSAGYAATCVDASCNNPSWTKDAKGNQTDYEYDTTTGLVTKVRAPAPTSGANRPELRYSYTDVSGTKVVTGVSACQTGTAPSCVGTADEVKQTLGYDARLNHTTSTVAAGNGSVSATVTRTFDGVGNLLTVDDPLSGAADTTTYRWSADREQLGTISADPDGAGALKRRAVRTSYNIDGQATTAEVGTVNGTSDSDWSGFASLQQATASYDANARKTKDVLTAGGTTYGVTQYSYDAVGRLECAALRMNTAVWGSLPASACTLQSTGSAGPDRITKAIYDAAGQLTKSISALGTTEQADDATGTYSNNGRLRTLADANSNLTTYEYDGFDRLVKTRYPVATLGANISSTTDYEQLGYDANSSITSQRLRDGNSIGYGYDALLRLVMKDLPGGEPDVSYSYDLLSRPIGASTSQQTLSFGYDALGRNLTQGGPLGTVSSQYDAAGQRTRLTWADGFYVTYDYFATGEMKAIRENGAGSGAGVLATFGYDDLGRRVSLTRGNGTVTNSAFDPVSRLGMLGHDLAGSADDLTIGLGYNPASQIASTTRSNDVYAWGSHYNRNTGYTLNGLNQATAAGLAGIGYDVRGNTTSIGAASYGYSSENLLLSGPSSATLTYDPLARLFQASQSQTVRFQYDGLNMIGEHNGSNALQRRYVFGPGADEPLVWYEGSGTSDRRWLHADERGSVVAVTNGSGTRTAINSYDESGVPAAGNSGRFGYTGQTWLPELEKWYYKARMYAPTLGRFMQTDPIGYADGPNWYNYVGSDPVNRRDPLGLCGGEDATAREKNEDCADIVVIGNRGGGGAGSGGGGGGGGGGGTILPNYDLPDVVSDLPQNEQPQFCPIAYTPFGDSKGENPKINNSGSTINSDLPGSWRDAWNTFSSLSRLAGETDWTTFPNPSFDNATTLAVSQPTGAIRLRVGVDFNRGVPTGTSPRINIRAGTFQLRKDESIHFTGGRGKSCPQQ